MLYDLTVKIAYEYQAPVGASRHLLRFFPRDIPGVQRAVATSVTIQPQPAERSVFTDAFGNQTEDVLLRGDHERLEIGMMSRIDRRAPPPPSAPGASIADIARELAGVLALGAESPHHYTGASPRVRVTAATTEFARSAADGETHAVAVVRRIGAALNKAMVFDAKATEVNTPLEEAFANRRGVCQDFTHIMIACLRGLGLPAGYVSGYLRTIPPPGKERLAGADAMHAWVRAWCGAGVGWFEYDPTNALEIGEHHIVAGYGRDYFDVAPVKGVLRTIGAHHSSQAVDMIEAA